MRGLKKSNPDNFEQTKYLKKIHRWINATFILNLLIAGITLWPLVTGIYLRQFNPESDDVFYSTVGWFMINFFTIPAGIIVSLFSFFVLREWRAQKLSNQNYSLAYITIILGLLPMTTIAIVFLAYNLN